MRIDRFLWFTRLSAKRSYAQELASAGRLRLSGRVIEKASVTVRVGDVLTFADHRGRVRVIRVELLPERRGPYAEASRCYADLSPGVDGAEPAS